jgi:hypothetical protein
MGRVALPNPALDPKGALFVRSRSSGKRFRRLLDFPGRPGVAGVSLDCHLGFGNHI